MSYLGKFTSKRWGTVEVFSDRYGKEDGPLAITLINDGEPLATLSVNMYKPECSADSRELKANQFYAKTWSENAEIAEEAAASGLFRMREDLPEAYSGFVSAPVWEVV